MEAKGLEIGNFISHENCTLFRIDEIRPTDRGYTARMYPFLYNNVPNRLDSWVDLALEDAKPIQLTDEIMRDWCRFKQNEFAQREFNFGFFRCINHYEDGFLCGFIGNEIFTMIQYLHQLQNLYFALMGKELEIKMIKTE